MIDYQFHKVQGRIEATTELHWYAAKGYWRVNILDFGKNEKQARESADDMVRQARTALQLATIEDSSNRVPTSPENAGV